MKKKMAIVLSAILACSMGMTAMAAPSPSIQKEPVAQVVVSPSVGTSNTVTTQAVSVSSDKSAVLPGTTFKTASGQVVDPSAVAMVIAPASAEQAQASAASLAAALASSKMQVVNFTGRSGLSLTDSNGNLNVVTHGNWPADRCRRSCCTEWFRICSVCAVRYSRSSCSG